MANLTVTKEFVQTLVNSSDRFPVDFDDAWQWLGYTKKSNAKKKLVTNFEGGIDFCSKWSNQPSTNASGFVSVEKIYLTVDCFKELGMLAGTEQGKLVRKYYLECERVVREVIPAQSDRIRELELEIELRKAEAAAATAQKVLLDKREWVTHLPEPVQQKILGYDVVERVEYRDRTITPTGQINDGIGITYIQKRYGFKSTKETWAWLERLGMGKMDGKWKHELRAVESSVLPREYLDELDVMFGDSQRPLWLGE